MGQSVDERKASIRKAALKWYHKNRDRRKQANKEYQRRKVGLPQPTRPEPVFCELCGGPPNGRGDCLHLDHDHKTGVFRGWLCCMCNQALGLLRDNPDLCIAAAKYLRTADLL